LAASRSFDVPDVTFVLEAPDAIRQARMATRDRTERYEEPDLASGLRESYERSIALLTGLGHRIETVDATPPVDEVVAEILRRLDATR
jgi:thymidylate kinase